MKIRKDLHSSTNRERGSLALEQVLFIGAIVAMSAGLFVFYDNIADYFRSVDMTALPTTVSNPSGN